MNDFIRLNKFISTYGNFSRRKADELIEQGRVDINQKTIVELGYKIDPEKDKVFIDGELIKVEKRNDVYIMLNKPEEVVTSTSDEKHRTTVIDLINLKQRIYPIGRLDYNTTGLLLLTNDGDFANSLMHPKFGVYKTYIAKLSRPLEEKDKIKLTKGIFIDKKKTEPSKIKFLHKKDPRIISISIYEGRNRQIRKMFEALGYFVKTLHRVEYGNIKLGDLPLGKWRKLTKNEIQSLKNIVRNSN